MDFFKRNYATKMADKLYKYAQKYLAKYEINISRRTVAKYRKELKIYNKNVRKISRWDSERKWNDRRNYKKRR